MRFDQAYVDQVLTQEPNLQFICSQNLAYRVSSDRRFLLLKQFEAMEAGVLIITRGTGKRGLDIPKAHYAVIYSPKEDEYVWQELSTIRSTLEKGKESYILFYFATREETKLHNLKVDMQTSSNRYRFVKE